MELRAKGKHSSTVGHASCMNTHMPVKKGISSVRLFSLGALYCHDSCNVLRQSISEGPWTPSTGLHPVTQKGPERLQPDKISVP